MSVIRENSEREINVRVTVAVVWKVVPCSDAMETVPSVPTLVPVVFWVLVLHSGSPVSDTLDDQLIKFTWGDLPD